CAQAWRSGKIPPAARFQALRPVSIAPGEGATDLGRAACVARSKPPRATAAVDERQGDRLSRRLEARTLRVSPPHLRGTAAGHHTRPHGGVAALERRVQGDAIASPFAQPPDKPKPMPGAVVVRETLTVDHRALTNRRAFLNRLI